MHHTFMYGLHNYLLFTVKQPNPGLIKESIKTSIDWDNHFYQERGVDVSKTKHIIL